jgi:hypothetical protein
MAGINKVIIVGNLGSSHHSGYQPSLKSASCCVNTARLTEPIA